MNPKFNTTIMGDAKRRKEALGDQYGKEANLVSWLPITKSQATKFVEWSSKGAWVGIGFLIAAWLTIRFVGPAFGWWQLS
jgi:hypothetical protein